MESEVKITSSVANDGRRFSLVIEGVTSTLAGDKVIISGDLHGTIKKGDQVYVTGLREYTTGTVTTIEVTRDGKFESPEEATDETLSLVLQVENDKFLKKFGVVTSVKPTEKFDGKSPLENPFLSGLLHIAPKYQQDKLYIGLLSATLAHSVFVSPMKAEQNPETKEMKMGFYMLPAKRVVEGQMPSEFLLPVFTDLEELSKWSALSKPGTKVPISPLNFIQTVDLTKPEPVKGFVVNPFSTNMLIANEGLINAIINSDGFKNDFGKKDEAKEA